MKKKEMKSFVLHDDSVNTYGFRMLTSGADLSDFEKNPVLLIMHNDYDLPPGRWENIRIEGNKILADPVLDENDPKGKAAKEKVENDFIRMASIGAWPPEEVSDDPALKLPGQTGPTVTKWKVREASLVTVGSNHNAMAFYDRETGKKIELKDNNFMDFFNVKPNNKKKMNKLNQILNLADNAEELDQFQAIQAIINAKADLEKENERLVKLMDEQKKAAAEARKTQAIALIDAAVKDGRIDATQKDNYIKLFDADFDSAQAILDAIPKRRSVAGMIDAAEGQSNTKLADLQKKSWDELDKGGKLADLKVNFPDVYTEKFEERFGHKPE